jgi:hypothetical protein
VIVAVGLSDFRQVPAELAALPPGLVTHSAEHRDLSSFKGRDVSVIGGGSSALDVVASLRASGAYARLVARRPALKWNMPVKPHPWRRLYPNSGLGAGWRNAFFEHAPMVFRYLPQETRMHIVRRWLGPAGGWPARQAVEQGPVLLGQLLRGAEYRDGRVQLRLLGRDGGETVVATDHVIAATGYKVDLRRLGFLGSELQTDLRTADHTPILSSRPFPTFISSVSRRRTRSVPSCDSSWVRAIRRGASQGISPNRLPHSRAKPKIIRCFPRGQANKSLPSLSEALTTAAGLALSAASGRLAYR